MFYKMSARSVYSKKQSLNFILFDTTGAHRKLRQFTFHYQPPAACSLFPCHNKNGWLMLPTTLALSARVHWEACHRQSLCGSTRLTSIDQITRCPLSLLAEGQLCLTWRHRDGAEASSQPGQPGCGAVGWGGGGRGQKSPVITRTGVTVTHWKAQRNVNRAVRHSDGERPGSPQWTAELHWSQSSKKKLKDNYKRQP